MSGIDWDSALDEAEAGALGEEREVEQETAQVSDSETNEDVEAALEESHAEESSAPDDDADSDDVPEVDDRDPAWYRKNTTKLRARARAEEARNIALQQRLDALEAAQGQQQSQPQSARNQPVDEEAVYEGLLEEMGIDPDIESDSMLRMARVMARERVARSRVEGQFNQSQHDIAVRQLNSKIDSVIQDNPMISRQDLMHAAARGESMTAYVADRRMALDEHLASMGYARSNAAESTESKRSSPKPMPVEKRASGAAKAAPANKSSGKLAVPEWAGKAPPKLDIDDDLDALFANVR
jgi:hypothetical protein